MTAPITTRCRFGLTSTQGAIIKADIEISIPAGVAYAQIYEDIAEPAASSFRAAVRSRLDPSAEDLSILTASAKELGATQGEEFAKGWIQGVLDPKKYRVLEGYAVEALSGAEAVE
jgi:hypothetical protein